MAAPYCLMFRAIALTLRAGLRRLRPPSAPLRRLRDIFLVAQPLLLWEALGFAQRNGNGTQEAHRSHKKHKKTSFALLFCASCALNCAFCVPSPFRCAKPRLWEEG